MKDKAKPIVTEVYSDNGELSHYRLIDPDTGENLWSEDPDEDKTLGYPVKSAPLVTDEETQDEVEKLFFQYCREEGMDDDDIKAASWRTSGMIDFGVWLQSRLSQPGREYCECKFSMIRRDENTQTPYCFECKKEINESQPVTGYSEEDIREAIRIHIPDSATVEFRGLKYVGSKIDAIIQSLKSKPNNGSQQLTLTEKP